MKKLHTIYLYGVNERVKFSNLEQPGGRLLPLPRFGNRRENLKKDVSMNQPNLTQLRPY